MSTIGCASLMAMASRSITKLVEQGERAKKSLTNMRTRAKVEKTRMLGLGLGLGGAGAAAYIDASMGEGAEDLEVLGVPAVPAVSAALSLLALSNKVPGGEQLASFANGALFYSFGAFVRRRAEES